MHETPETWVVDSNEPVADCRVFSVRKDFAHRESDGKKASFFVIENPDWVNVIALTPDDEIVMIEQFRHGTNNVILELPGGMIDDGEDPEAAARRELEEETGFTSEVWVRLGTSHPNPALQNNEIHHYLAVGARKTSQTAFDDHESVVTVLMPRPEVEQAILDGRVTHSLVVTAFYYFIKQYENIPV